MPEVAAPAGAVLAGHLYRIARDLHDAGRALGDVYGALPEAQRLAVDQALGDADYHRGARALEAIADAWLDDLKPELSK